MEKIEKLKGSYDVPQLRQKLNEIIDYLNTQPQTEEGKQPEGSFRDWCIQKAKLGRFKDMSIPEPQSTPEQKEEWEEGFNRYWGCMFERGDYEKLIGDIKNLLLERERWAINTFLKDTASYNSFHNGRPRTMRNGLSGEGFEVRVSKLKDNK